MSIITNKMIALSLEINCAILFIQIIVISEQILFFICKKRRVANKIYTAAVRHVLKSFTTYILFNFTMIPNVVFKARVRDNSINDPNPFRWKDVSTNDLFSGKRVCNSFFLCSSLMQRY